MSCYRVFFIQSFYKKFTVIYTSKANIFKTFDEMPKGILLHGCNCQGKYASGFALQVKEKYPEAYTAYIDFIAKSNTTILGSTSVADLGNDKFVHNGFTQIFYGRNKNVVYVSYNAIRSVFKFANKMAIEHNVALLFPNIGTGLGGGDAARVRKIMDEEISEETSAYLFLQT